MRALLVAHFGATAFMTGLVWMVQWVHYPMFAWVGREGAEQYAAEHARRITWIVAPAMLLELVTGVWIGWRGNQWVRWSLLPLAVVWVSTAVVQVPLHGRLQAGWEAEAHRRLVATNWIRTAMWSVRALLVGLAVAKSAN